MTKLVQAFCLLVVIQLYLPRCKKDNESTVEVLIGPRASLA